MKQISINEKSVSFTDIVAENKDIIYTVLLYISGLLIGSILFKGLNEETRNAIKSFLEIGGTDFKNMLINRAAYYLIIFVVCLALGFSAIGFPLLSLIPTALGAITGLKIAYYYISLGLKGFGYSSLLITPQAALFITVIVFTVRSCKKLSRGILQNSIKKADMAQELSLASYLKQFGVLFLILILIILINTLTVSSFSPLIKLG